ncbi:MAG: glycoside hydrolase, partial [Lachnospiraceae bacterium]|nr:glycoside hydrolase [Lachnospiraceae bacterium]
MVEPLREDIIRVRFSRKELQELPSLIIDAQVKNSDATFTVTEKQVMQDGKTCSISVLNAGDLIAEVNEENGRIEWFLKAHTEKPVLKEGERTLTEIPVYQYTTNGEKPIVNRVKTVDGERNFIQNLEKKEVRKAYRGKYYIEFQGEEGIYGFGQAEEGVFNLRHHTQYLYQHNMRIPMPMCYCDAGYGILFDCTSLMTWNDDINGSYLFMDTIDQMEYYVIAGPSPDDVIDGFRYLTGRAGMLPKWADGYVQSKEQYYSSDELYEVVKHYRDLNVPLDLVVQDWNSWAPGQWGEKKLDPARYANQKERNEDIHKLHAHTMVSIWPNMNSTTSDHAQFMEQGYMLNDLGTYNAFEEQARDLYWKQAKEGLFEQGFDSWWCDSTEPFTGPDWNGEEKREPWERYHLVGEEHKKFLDPGKANAFALMHAKGIYEHQKHDYPEKRVLNLTRSGYASGQKYGAMLWSGDTYASWDTLRKQIVEGLNMSISGYPFWTLDIGGFFTIWKEWTRRGCSCNNDPTPKWFWRGDYEDGVADAGYRELYVRWIEFGCFLPMFRSHGTDTPRE